MKYLVISSSLNASSRSRQLAQRAYELLKQNHSAQWLDLRDFPLPICDGDVAYTDPNVTKVSEMVQSANVILLAVPVYNYACSAAAKNLIELTGSAWNEKVVGFLCAAGGKSSYMSIMGLANSLMLDFRCLIIPRFVYADRSAFTPAGIDASINGRIEELVTKAVRLSQWHNEAAAKKE